MKTIIYFMLAAGIVVFSSCASYQKTAPLIGYEHSAIQTNLVADLDMDNAKKVKGTIETKKLFGFISLKKNGHKYLKSANHYRNLTSKESQALYKVKEASEVDLILDPEFSFEKHSWFFGAYKNTITTVTGWGVNVKSLRQVE